MTLQPYIIAGKVFENGTTNPSASNNVTLTNETTGDRISTITNSQGQYAFDLANLLNGYSDGDFIRVTATGGLSNGQNLRFKAVCKTDFAQIENIDISYEV